MAELYLSARSYMTPLRVFLYVTCGAAMAFGLIVAFMIWFDSGKLNTTIGTLLPFGVLPIAGLTFLALTQETGVREPMKRQRAALYTCAVAVLVFGLLVFAITYVSTGLAEAIATLIPFALPSATLAAFLLLTEQDRRKPWVKAQIDAAKDPVYTCLLYTSGIPQHQQLPPAKLRLHHHRKNLPDPLPLRPHQPPLPAASQPQALPTAHRQPLRRPPHLRQQHPKSPQGAAHH